MIFVLFVDFFPLSYIKANDSEKANNLYLEWKDWYYNEIIYILGIKHHVNWSKVVEILKFLEDHYYFEKEWKEKVVFIQVNSKKYPELRYVGEITNIPTDIKGGTILEADKRSFWEKEGLTNVNNQESIFVNPNLSATGTQVLGDPFYIYVGLNLKPSDKSKFSPHVLEFFYSQDGPLKKYYDKINKKTYPDFSEAELQILRGWAMKKNVDSSFSIAMMMSSIQVKGAGSVKITSKVIKDTKTWQNSVNRLSNKIACQQTIAPQTYDIPMFRNSYQAKYWVLYGEGKYAVHTAESFNQAAKSFNKIAGPYGWNITSDKLKKMSYIGPANNMATGPKTHAEFFQKEGKILLNEEYFFASPIAENSHSIIHEYLHSAYRKVKLNKYDLVEEGINDFFCLQINPKISSTFQKESYAANKLFNQIKIKYPDRTLYNMQYFAYSTHDSYSAAQRINPLFKNKNVYENLNNLLNSLRNTEYDLSNEGKQIIDNFFNNLQLK